MTVVNKRTNPEFDVYIGRGSKWGNPYSHRDDTRALYRVATRTEAIACYRRALWEDIKLGRVELTELAELHGKTLGCFCAPLPCHGDVLIEAARWANLKLKGLA